MKLPQLSLRDLFWLLLVAGIALGWWMDRQRKEARHERLAAALQRVYQTSLQGQPLEDVVRQQELEKFQVWQMPNLPPGAEAEVTYFLDEGNLTLHFSGDPAVISQAEFHLSDQSADERFRMVTQGWSKWVDAHSE